MFISYFVSFVLHFVTIRGESCKRFRSVRNIAVDPSTCQMEMFATPVWTFDCVEKCDENHEVRYFSLPKNSRKMNSHHLKVGVRDPEIW